jgi:hypothetical protein
VKIFSKLLVAASVVSVVVAQRTFVNQTTCNGKRHADQELAGYGLISGNAGDEYGDTIGGIGPALALDRSQWVKLVNGSYSGVLWDLPGRGSSGR